MENAEEGLCLKHRRDGHKFFQGYSLRENQRGNNRLSNAVTLQDVHYKTSYALYPNHGLMKIPTICGDAATAEHMTYISKGKSDLRYILCVIMARN